jgi:hypothetical protein
MDLFTPKNNRCEVSHDPARRREGSVWRVTCSPGIGFRNRLSWCHGEEPGRTGEHDGCYALI